GLSKVESWRPAFGSLSDAYSLKNVWGKFWYQLLRRPLTGPASAITHDFLELPRNSMPRGLVTLFLSFTPSAVLHIVAGLSSGAPIAELGVFRFFWTQAFSITVEEALRALLIRVQYKRNCGQKSTGYVWVGAFLTWSDPAWLYPQISRPSKPGPGGFLPFSIVR
ncbi:membrane bound O-acyl transferase family-domain-containing protein, partial [Phaeosphaeriaceae sp. PMI808]